MKRIIILILIIALLLVACGKEEKIKIQAKPVDDNTSDMDKIEFVDSSAEDEEENETEAEEVELEEEAEIEEEDDEEIEEVEVNETDDNETSTETIIEDIEDDDSPAETAGTDIEVVSSKTKFGYVRKFNESVNSSVFSDVKCVIGTALEDAGYAANTAEDDEIYFTLTNKDAREYYLPLSKPSNSPTNDYLKVLINNRRIRDVENKCGSKYIKPGQTLKCHLTGIVLKSGTSVHGQTMENSLAADSVYMESKLKFRC